MCFICEQINKLIYLHSVLNVTLMVLSYCNFFFINWWDVKTKFTIWQRIVYSQPASKLKIQKKIHMDELDSVTQSKSKEHNSTIDSLHVTRYQGSLIMACIQWQSTSQVPGKYNSLGFAGTLTRDNAKDEHCSPRCRCSLLIFGDM